MKALPVCNITVNDMNHHQQWQANRETERPNHGTLKTTLSSGTIPPENGTISGFLLHSLVPFTVTNLVTIQEF